DDLPSGPQLRRRAPRAGTSSAAAASRPTTNPSTRAGPCRSEGRVKTALSWSVGGGVTCVPEPAPEFGRGVAVVPQTSPRSVVVATSWTAAGGSVAPSRVSGRVSATTTPIVWLQFSPIRWISSPGDVLIVSVAGVSAVPHG